MTARPSVCSNSCWRAGPVEELVLLGETDSDQFSLAVALIFRGRDRIEDSQAAAGIEDYE